MGEACINQRVESVSESPLLLLTSSIMKEEDSTFHRDQRMPEEMMLNLVSANGSGRAGVEQEKGGSLQVDWERERDRKRQRRKQEEREKEKEGGGGGKRLMPPPFRKQYHQSTGCQWVAQYIPLPPGEASLEHHLWVVLSFKLHLSLLSFSDASNKSVKTLSAHCLVPIMLPFSWVPYFGCMNRLTYRACGCPVWHQEGMHVPPGP